ncbi:MAG: NAD(P)/FAD-dependent oxidoreductase [Candidatus Coproplasma sp.]
MKYLLIGNSTAAIACIEAIRTLDKQGEITVLSKETQFCYGRPTISYCLAGLTDREHMNYRPLDFYDKMGVSLHLGVSAESIDADKKQVKASDGKKYSYDKLLVSTGSRPFVPFAEGLDKVKNAFTFMSYDDMDALDKAISPEKEVVVIGAGLIGLKCVEGIFDRVKKVTVVDLATRVMPSVTEDESAAMIQSFLEKKGVEFVLGDCAASYTENSVTLKSGKTLSFDILVTAAGVRANTSLIADIGGKVNRGVLVNTRQQTSISDIYAAGDCTEGYDSSIGAERVLALMPNAYLQGKTAGLNMAGGDSEYKDAIPLNAVGFFGLHMLSAGVYEGEIIKVKGENSLKLLFVKDNTLKGFILINDFLRAGIYTSLVRGKTPLDGVDFDMLVNAPQLLAFPAEARAAKLSRRA